MRHFAILLLLLVSTVSFAQNSGAIIGVVLDEESFNEPLLMAKVTVEGTSLQASTDENGTFLFDNLNEGNYTLLINFAGYETKQLNVHVDSNKPTNVISSLIAKTLSLNDLTSINKVDGKE